MISILIIAVLSIYIIFYKTNDKQIIYKKITKINAILLNKQIEQIKQDKIFSISNAFSCQKLRIPNPHLRIAG